MGRVEEKEGRMAVGSCLNRGLSLMTRMTRILGIFVYCRFLVRRTGAVYYGLRTQTGKFALQRSGRIAIGR